MRDLSNLLNSSVDVLKAFVESRDLEISLTINTAGEFLNEVWRWSGIL